MFKAIKGLVSKRIFSITTTTILILNTMMIGINLQVPTTKATAVNHDFGNLDINALSDYGRLLAPISWSVGPVWNYQTTREITGTSFIGLVIDQDNYVHTPGFEDIVDSFGTYPYASPDDLTNVSKITLVINDGETQKSVASFQNTGSETGDPNDILIDQICWTRNNTDWAILQWKLNNLKGVSITGVSFGLELSLSQAGNSYGVGGDSGDDVDGFDGVNEVYWAQDNNGTGTCLGFASAIPSDPITHYYSKDYHPSTYDDYKLLWENETWLYDRLHSPNSVEGNSVAGNRTSTVGWNGITLGAGSSRTLTLVIAANDTYNNMITALEDARYYYQNLTTGFLITEIRDSESPTPRIEVFNNGRPPTDPTNFLSFTANIGALSGTWSHNPIPTYGYSVFTTNEALDPEGDTISLYQKGTLIEAIGYGLKGTTPDPLADESVERYWDGSKYTNVWERNWSTGPNFGLQNNVPPANFTSWVLLNEILFNPIVPGDAFVGLYLRTGALDISGYKIVGDREFIIPEGVILTPTNPFFYLLFSMDPSFFAVLDPAGDNVYLYDDNGSLLDMAGWSSMHQQGKSMKRIPDGNGTRNGFDDESSIIAGWVFDSDPSISIPPPPPAPPTGLMAQLINNAEDVMLFWNASADDGKGENDIAGYTVYKSSIGINGTYEFLTWIPATGSPSYYLIDSDAGDGDWNNYFYLVRANDTEDLEEENTDKAGKFVNYLVDGWNLFSVPLIQYDTSMEYVLQTVEGNYTIVQGYHAGKSRPWLHWHRDKPNKFNDDIEIDHKHGYYIDMIVPDYLVVAGAVPVNTHIQLKAGWNLIGYPCLVNQTVQDAFSSIAGKYNMVEYYDTVIDKEVRLGSDDWMQPGLGYWVHATEDCILIIQQY